MQFRHGDSILLRSKLRFARRCSVLGLLAAADRNVTLPIRRPRPSGRRSGRHAIRSRSERDGDIPQPDDRRNSIDQDKTPLRPNHFSDPIHLGTRRTGPTRRERYDARATYWRFAEFLFAAWWRLDMADTPSRESSPVMRIGPNVRFIRRAGHSADSSKHDAAIENLQAAGSMTRIFHVGTKRTGRVSRTGNRQFPPDGPPRFSLVLARKRRCVSAHTGRSRTIDGPA